jgi:hypothetical protein
LNISNIVPEAVASFVANQIHSLQPLEGILVKITPANIKGSLISGLVLLGVIASILLYFAFKVVSFASLFLRLLRWGVYFLCLLFCVALLIPTITTHYVQSKIHAFGPIVGIEKGGVFHQFILIVSCAGVMALSAIFVSVSI